MRIHTIRIPCTDMEAAETFYAALFGIGKSFGSASEGYVGFGLENVSVLLEPVEAGEFESGRYLGLSFEVPDIGDFYERQRNAMRFIGPPEVQFWGGTMAHVADSSGNVLSIVETTDDA